MLKKYQHNTIDALMEFLQRAAHYKDVNRAYQECTRKNFGFPGSYNDAGFVNTPYVCLRLPTGGGKTLLAASSIPIVTKEYLGRDFSLVIWLVPTTTILEQTYRSLINNSHPYRIVLNEAFNGNVEIIKLDDAKNITKGTLQSNTTIIISTFSSWRINDKEGRKVYEQNGQLFSHFEHLNSSMMKHLEKINGSDIPVQSLANVVHLNNPIFIIDEAHNARTELTFEVLKRLNPACLLEFTATPKTDPKSTDRSNVLYSVTAAELKADHMIKMPIILETTSEWQTAISDSIKKQQELEIIAKEEELLTGEYIRPIVLLQAQNDSQTESTINVEEVKNFLINTLKIPENEIAIATGNERGIEGKDLSSPDESIRYIITKQALKEGWDCPFAYVFCSVAKVMSKKDVEQLLGRVLRMPKVKEKIKDQLNKAYAFVSSNSFFNTARNLEDALVDAGFTAKEASELVDINPQQYSINYFSTSKLQLSEAIDESKINPSLLDKIEYVPEDRTIKITSDLSEVEIEEVKRSLALEEDQKKIDLVFQEIQFITKKAFSPSKNGNTFSLPQLFIDFEGDKRVFDEEVLLPHNWDLTQTSTSLDEDEFPVRLSTGLRGSIDVDNKGHFQSFAPTQIQEELANLILSSTITKEGLILWLVRECRDQFIPYAQLIVFISLIIEDLLSTRNLEIAHLVFLRFKLKDAIKAKIRKHISETKKISFQQLLFLRNEDTSISRFSLGEDFSFPETYPANSLYSGSFKYSKHYYSDISFMNDEEAECAFTIDSNPNVEFWVRNLERQENYAFWLQTSTDKFYPDFIAKMKDNSIVIIEYKNTLLYSTDDSKEKKIIGEFYASLNPDVLKFVMLKGKDWKTLNNILI